MDLIQKNFIKNIPVCFGEKGIEKLKSCKADLSCAYLSNRVADIYGFEHIYQWAH